MFSLDTRYSRRNSIDRDCYTRPVGVGCDETTSTKRIRHSIIISAGFREMGTEGIEMEEKIKQVAIENNIRILGPNCLGVLDNYTNFTTSFLPWERVSKPKKGHYRFCLKAGHLLLRC